MFPFFYFDFSLLIAFAINFCLILLFHRVPVLTRSGYLHAGALGTILLASIGLRAWLSVVVYLILGSAVTKLGFYNKQQRGLAESRGGKRGPENVWGSSATGAFLSIIYTLHIWPESLVLIGFASSFSAKLADTFGSEIGKRWGTKTYLISSLRKVQPGTEGAISLEGTIASLIGGFIMAMVMWIFKIISSYESIILITFVALLATLLESFIGALVQNRFRLLNNEIVNSIQTSIAALLSIIIANKLDVIN